jgi:hypothetical protein
MAAGILPGLHGVTAGLDPPSSFRATLLYLFARRACRAGAWQRPSISSLFGEQKVKYRAGERLVRERQQSDVPLLD